jgi:hypothetical protein
LIYCKKLCKCHSVLLPSTTIYKKGRTKKTFKREPKGLCGVLSSKVIWKSQRQEKEREGKLPFCFLLLKKSKFGRKLPKSKERN